jgi:hypothetical protein
MNVLTFEYLRLLTFDEEKKCAMMYIYIYPVIHLVISLIIYKEKNTGYGSASVYETFYNIYKITSQLGRNIYEIIASIFNQGGGKGEGRSPDVKYFF